MNKFYLQLRGDSTKTHKKPEGKETKKNFGATYGNKENITEKSNE